MYLCPKSYRTHLSTAVQDMLNNGVLHLTRRTRRVQIIKMQKVERLDPGLILLVPMPFNPLKGLDDPGGELLVCNRLPQGYVVCSASTHFVPQNKVRSSYTISTYCISSSL